MNINDMRSIWVFWCAVPFLLCCPGDSTKVNVKWIVRLGLSLPCWLIDSPVNTTAGTIHKACKCYLNIHLMGVCVFTHACEALKVPQCFTRMYIVYMNIQYNYIACVWNMSFWYKCVFPCLMRTSALIRKERWKVLKWDLGETWYLMFRTWVQG